MSTVTAGTVISTVLIRLELDGFGTAHAPSRLLGVPGRCRIRIALPDGARDYSLECVDRLCVACCGHPVEVVGPPLAAQLADDLRAQMASRCAA